MVDIRDQIELPAPAGWMMRTLPAGVVQAERGALDHRPASQSGQLHAARRTAKPGCAAR